MLSGFFETTFFIELSTTFIICYYFQLHLLKADFFSKFSQIGNHAKADAQIPVIFL
jgi:hypothetical protein